MLGDLAVFLFLVGGVLAGVEDLSRAGEGQRVGFDGHRAHRPGFDPAVARVGLGKKGVAAASFFSAFWRTVG